MKSIKQLFQENVLAFLKRGPGLRYSTNTWVVARDPAHGMILLGGLGALGVGEMWVKEGPLDKTKPGYEEAKIIEAPTNGASF